MFERFKNWIAPKKDKQEITTAKDDVTKAYDDQDDAKRQILIAEYDIKIAGLYILRNEAILKLEEKIGKGARR